MKSANFIENVRFTNFFTKIYPIHFIRKEILKRKGLFFSRKCFDLYILVQGFNTLSLMNVRDQVHKSLKMFNCTACDILSLTRWIT